MNKQLNLSLVAVLFFLLQGCITPVPDTGLDWSCEIGSKPHAQKKQVASLTESLELGPMPTDAEAYNKIIEDSYTDIVIFKDKSKQSNVQQEERNLLALGFDKARIHHIPAPNAQPIALCEQTIRAVNLMQTLASQANSKTYVYSEKEDARLLFLKTTYDHLVKKKQLMSSVRSDFCGFKSHSCMAQQKRLVQLFYRMSLKFYDRKELLVSGCQDLPKLSRSDLLFVDSHLSCRGVQFAWAEKYH